MNKKLTFTVVVLVAGLLLAACGGSGETEMSDEAAQQIADLQAQVDAANAAGGDSAEAEALQAELDALQAELENRPTDSRCTYNAYRMGWLMDYADANNMVSDVFGPTSAFQYTFWQQDNPEAASTFAGLVDSALLNTDLESRATTWQEAEKILISDEVAVLPIYHYDNFGLVSTDLSVVFPPFGAARFADWSFESGASTLRYAMATAVPTLDPQAGTDTTSSAHIYQMFDAPYRFNAEGGIEPLSATGFEVSEDGTVYTIHFREDAVWSDGEPVTAQHYVDGVTRLLDPELANSYAYVMFPIDGAEAFNAGDAETLDSIVAVDDFTMQVTLTDSLSFFDSILAFSTFHPVRMDVIEEFGDDWTLPGNMVGNGAYVLTDLRPGETAVFEKNELYWDADNVQIERIEFPVITEQATALAAFENGEVDATVSAGFPPEDTSRLVDTPEFLRLPRPGTYYLGLNTVTGPTANLDMRKALASSIDKRVILDNVAETPWRTVAYGVIPPEIVGFQGDAVGYGFDMDAAQGYLQAYMDAEGIADPGEIVVELWYNKSGANQQILEAVEAMWEENLGIDVRTVNVEWATYLDILTECNAIGGGGF